MLNTTASPKSISAMDLRRSPGEFLDRVDYRNETFVIEQYGEPKAVLISVREYQQAQQKKSEAKKRLFVMIDSIRQQFADEDPEVIEQEIEAALQESRQQV